MPVKFRNEIWFMVNMVELCFCTAVKKNLKFFYVSLESQFRKVGSNLCITYGNLIYANFPLEGS